MPDPAQAARVRELAKGLAKRFPGKTIELRVPPWIAVQLGFGDGSRHTRGTPPNVVEMDPQTFLDLADGVLDWDAASPARLRASGAHASELKRAFPIGDVLESYPDGAGSHSS